MAAFGIVGEGCAELGAEVLSGKVMNLEPSRFLYLAPLPPVGEVGGGGFAAGAGVGAGCFRAPPLDFIAAEGFYFGGASVDVIEKGLATARIVQSGGKKMNW